LALLIFQETVDRLGRDPELPRNPGCAPPQLDQPSRRIAPPLPDDTNLGGQPLHIGMSRQQFGEGAPFVIHTADCFRLS
jgi:hypothetical protein